MIKVVNLCYITNKKIILDNINLKINQGDFVGILGENGAGKSTLLKCLAGSLTIDSGKITIRDKNICDIPNCELACRRAFLTQSDNISFPFKVKDIVLMGRYPHQKRSNAKIDEKIIDETLEVVGLNDYKERYYSNLSGGEKQRVQIARNLSQIWKQKDSILFLDEPISALDIKQQYSILNFINNYRKEYNTTILCILHDLNITSMFADSIIMLKNSTIYAYGKTEEVLSEENIEHIYNIKVQSFLTENNKKNFIVII